ncbi:hypothetical protein F383_33227 [Gossypium arboreum]|uniref:Uncharacterized protein n=1 Tax=Gossypium arboreum TaxID=29729 RepID=A0A0B0N1F9_GOSAR|nr:hypothetical protein F383_33227 [Gossypium arboreum]
MTKLQSSQNFRAEIEFRLGKRKDRLIVDSFIRGYEITVLVELLHLLQTHHSSSIELTVFSSIELTIYQLRRSLPTMTRKSIGSLLARFGQVGVARHTIQFFIGILNL